MANALATHSNEGKIHRGLEHLGCAARNFVMIANTVGLTRFMEGLNGLPGRHFSDVAAERMLEVLGEMYELQIDLDAVTGSHVPIDFSKVDAVTTALTMRRVARIAAEGNDHTLDSRALRATTGISGEQMNGCVIDLDKPCVNEIEIVDIAVEFLSEGRPMSECRGHLLSEYDVNANDLGRLLKKAEREVRACEVEFGTRLRF